MADKKIALLMTNIQSGDMELAWTNDGFDRELWHETPLCAMTYLLDEAAAEITRLNAAVKWEQNRSGRIGTHGPGCGGV